MKDKLLEIKLETINLINDSTNEQELLKVKSNHLGKKSKLNEILKELKNLSIDEKKEIGKLSNEIKTELEVLIKDNNLEIVQ